MITQYELIKKILKYDPQANKKLLNQAYIYGYKKHKSQKRASGDPYFSHSIEVAAILADLKLDTKVIIAGLLHDTIEDTNATYKEINNLFGKDIGLLVNGLTKINKLKPISRETAQSENLRKLFFAISKDIRVLLVKLADRLHNMRTIMHVTPKKRIRIAQETMDIYAPLAGRMGIHFFREELEDISFTVLNFKARKTIINRLQKMNKNENNLLNNIAKILKEKLKTNNIDAKVYGREKCPYSIFKKMERQSISLEKISDIYAFRIITENENDCYRALGLIHMEWPMVPKRFKDFISIPKSNDYRSIHTTIIGPNHKRIELQIRTKKMQEVNEFGIASHALYKENIYQNNSSKKNIGSVPLSKKTNAFEWLRHIVDALEDGDPPEEFLEHTKLELFADQIFCFTPKGRLIALPKYANSIDFAYAVHTDIGNTCVGCKINGIISSLYLKLNNGNEVEIIISKGSKPQLIWENFVITGKAKSSIKRANRKESRKQYINLGFKMLNRIFKKLKIEYTKYKLIAVLPKLSFKSVNEVYIAIATNKLKLRDVTVAIVPRLTNNKNINIFNKKIHFKCGATNKNISIPITIASKKYKILRLSKKYPPIAGERIIGIIKKNNELVVYPIDSDELEKFENNSELWVDLFWNIKDNENYWFTVPINITLLNEINALSKITTIIAEQGCYVWNSYILFKNIDFYNLYMDIEVKNIYHFNLVKNSLKSLPIINNIKRVAGKQFGEINI